MYELRVLWLPVHKVGDTILLKYDSTGPLWHGYWSDGPDDVHIYLWHDLVLWHNLATNEAHAASTVVFNTILSHFTYPTKTIKPYPHTRYEEHNGQASAFSWLDYVVITC
jgi:hypothetical protein